VPAAAPVPIAIFITTFEPGGTERQMIELVRRLDPSRWSVHLACFRAEGAWYQRAAEAARSVTAFPVASFKSLRAVKQLSAFARWCRRSRLAVVHTTELWSNSFGLPGAALAGVPVRIGNRREINPDKTPAQIAMQRFGYACAHTIVANSQAAAARLRLERVPIRKIAVIPNGLDASAFEPRPPRAPRRAIITIANLRREKAHDVLIDAAPSILRRVPDARFEIVGGGPEHEALVARAHARGVAAAFTFHGHCDDVAARLREADLFVLPSRSEAFPNAVLEAMAAGLPIVASATGGIRELVDHERTGLLVSPDDPAALAAAIVRMLSESSLAARLGAAARARAVDRFDFDRMVAGFEHVYLTALAQRGVAVAPHAELATS
jgi:glycosyltransferase involved in cell wall biosynthesis